MRPRIEDRNSELVDHFAQVVEDPLRVIATYESQSVDLHYIRDDIRAGYTDEELTKVFEQIEIEGMGYEHFQQLFHTGEMDCATYTFEAATMFHFPHDPFSGLIVSIDREADPDHEALIRLGKQAVGED